MKKTMIILFSIFAAVGIAMIVGSFVLLHAMNQFERMQMKYRALSRTLRSITILMIRSAMMCM